MFTNKETRRSFFVEAMSWAAGIVVAGLALGSSGCGGDDEPAVKYGGPDGAVVKYGGPGDGGTKVDAGPVVKYGGPIDGGTKADLGPVVKYGGIGDGAVVKYGGPG